MKRRLVIRLHAAQRMLERNILVDDIEKVIELGQTIESYPEDDPFPSRLILGWPKNIPLHVVAADEPNTNITHVITAYKPDPDQWDDDFRRRRK